MCPGSLWPTAACSGRLLACPMWLWLAVGMLVMATSSREVAVAAGHDSGGEEGVWQSGGLVLSVQQLLYLVLQLDKVAARCRRWYRGSRQPASQVAEALDSGGLDDRVHG